MLFVHVHVRWRLMREAMNKCSDILPGTLLGLTSHAPSPALTSLRPRNFSLIVDGHGGVIAALSSPSPGSSPKIAMSLSPSLEAGGGSPSSTSGTLPARLPRVSGAGDELQARLHGLHLAQRTASADGGSASASAASSSMATAGGADDDDFGDFEVSLWVINFGGLHFNWPFFQLGLVALHRGGRGQAHVVTWSSLRSTMVLFATTVCAPPLPPAGGVCSARGGGTSGSGRGCCAQQQRGAAGSALVSCGLTTWDLISSMASSRAVDCTL